MARANGLSTEVQKKEEKVNFLKKLRSFKYYLHINPYLNNQDSMYFTMYIDASKQRSQNPLKVGLYKPQ